MVYVGFAGGLKAGMQGRLRSHHHKKPDTSWSHFSVFKVWDNIPEQRIRELEGLLRYIYRNDSRASLNVQKGFKPLKQLATDRGWLLPAKRTQHSAKLKSQEHRGGKTRHQCASSPPARLPMNALLEITE